MILRDEPLADLEGTPCGGGTCTFRPDHVHGLLCSFGCRCRSWEAGDMGLIEAVSVHPAYLAAASAESTWHSAVVTLLLGMDAESAVASVVDSLAGVGDAADEDAAAYVHGPDPHSMQEVAAAVGRRVWAEREEVEAARFYARMRGQR